MWRKDFRTQTLNVQVNTHLLSTYYTPDTGWGMGIPSWLTGRLRSSRPGGQAFRMYVPRKQELSLPSSLFKCALHTKISFANIHKYRFNWKLSTPHSYSGNCWVMGVDWDTRVWLLNLLCFWIYPLLGLGNPSYLISPHSLHLPLLCRALTLRRFDEETEVSYFTGAMAPRVLSQRLSDFLVSPPQGTSTPRLPE